MDISPNRRAYLLIMAVFALPFSMSLMAHDPSEHMAIVEKPDCSAMGGAGDMKMDMSDPVAQAMMKQCMEDMASGDNRTELEHAKAPDDTVVDKHEHGKAQAVTH